MFELNLDRLPIGRSELPIEGPLALEGVPGEARLSGLLTVDAMDQKVLVTGAFGVRRTMDCHRCAEPIDHGYEAHVDLLILRTPTRGAEQDLDAGDGWVIHQQGGAVGLDEALREAVFLDEPIHVSCKNDECPTRPDLPAPEDDEIDPRWAALRKLREPD